MWAKAPDDMPVGQNLMEEMVCCELLRLHICLNLQATAKSRRLIDVQDLKGALERYWGHTEFRPGQQACRR